MAFSRFCRACCLVTSQPFPRGQPHLFCACPGTSGGFFAKRGCHLQDLSLLSSSVPSFPDVIMPPAKTKAKAKVPEYPRPVSPVCTDEIPICSDTVIYHEDSDGSEKDAERRAAKRRRIETCAHAYMRGEPVFILTAQLRGPFEKQWRNPWAKKRQNETGERSLEVSETTMKHSSNALDLGSSLVKRRRKTADTVARNGGKLTANPFDARGITEPVELPAPKSGREERGIDSWLKTNHAYAQSAPGESRSSPTPSYRPRDGQGRGRVSHIEENALQHASAVSDERAHPDPLKEKLEVVYDKKGHRHRSSEIDHTSGQRLSSAKATIRQPAENHLKPSATAPMGNSTKSELATMKSKSRSLHTVPSSTSLPALKNQRTSTDANRSAWSFEESAQIHHAGQTQMENISEKEMARGKLSRRSSPAPPPQPTVTVPMLSMETAKTGTIAHLPSAQPRPESPVLLSGFSNPTSTAQMLEEKENENCDHRSVEVVDISLAAPQPFGDVQSPKQGTEAAKAGGQDQDNASPSPQKKRAILQDKSGNCSALQLNTQQLLAGIPPFGVNTVKKDVAASEQRTPPGTAKLGHAKAKKKAMFATTTEPGASESAQGSIKSVMKVSKTASAACDKNGSPRSSPGAKFTSDQEIPAGGVERGREKRVSSPTSISRERDAIKPKSILKSSAASTGFSLSAAMLQDAQHVDADRIRMGHAAGKDADDFDLDAAIDDLGSYLGTWVPEEEASSL